MKVGVIELPAIKLVDSEGSNWTALRKHEPLVSKQILMPQLLAGGFDVQLVNLKDGNDEMEYGEVLWKGRTLTKILVGRNFTELEPRSMDVWGVKKSQTGSRVWPPSAMSKQNGKASPA